MADNLTFMSDGRVYHWSGGFGAVVKSFERGVQKGDTRIIEGELMYVYLVYPRRFRPAEVCWTFIAPQIGAIRSFRAKVFGVPIAEASPSPTEPQA